MPQDSQEHTEALQLKPTIKVTSPDGREIFYTEQGLREKIIQLREKTLKELYGPPLPQKAQRLLTLCNQALDAKPIEDSQMGLKGDKVQWFRVTVPLSASSFLTARITRKYDGRYTSPEPGATFIPASTDRYQTELRAAISTPSQTYDPRKRLSIKTDEVMSIWLEKVKDGKPVSTCPTVNIGGRTIDGRYLDSQDYFVNQVRQKIGQEAVGFLAQINPNNKPASEGERRTEEFINTLMFGSADYPIKLFPGIKQIPYIGYSRGLHQIEEPMVDKIIKAIENGDLDDGEYFMGKKQQELRNALLQEKKLDYQ